MSTKSLRAIVEQLVDFSLLEFVLWGHLKPECTMLQLKMKRPFSNPFLLPVAPFATAPLPSLFERVHAYIDSDGGHFEH
jgi:hypothetical protein